MVEGKQSSACSIEAVQNVVSLASLVTIKGERGHTLAFEIGRPILSRGPKSLQLAVVFQATDRQVNQILNSLLQALEDACSEVSWGYAK